MPEWLSFIDVVVAVIVLLFAWGGSQKGFAAQVAHVLTFVLMAVLLFFAYPFIYEYLGRVFRNLHETYLMWLLVTGLIVVAFLSYYSFSKLLAGYFETKMSDHADKVNGFLFGFFRGILTVGIVMILLIMLGSEAAYQKFNAKSQVGQLVCRELIPRIQPHASRSVLNTKVDAVRGKLMQREEAGSEIN
ncbi:MAG: CvpA family protein [Kiritimatiellaceae bacterium]|nr:CvpA family protein [Kiritimatiellaceae bacterium]